jgi:hypothetical protein
MKMIVLCTWLRILICQYLLNSPQRKCERITALSSQNMEGDEQKSAEQVRK